MRSLAFLALAIGVLLQGSCALATEPTETPASTMSPALPPAPSQVPSPTLLPSLPPVQPTTPVPQKFPQWDNAYLAIQPYVVSVVEGVVDKQIGSFTKAVQSVKGPQGQEYQQELAYSSWSIRIDRYLVKPLSYSSVVVFDKDQYLIHKPERTEVIGYVGEHWICSFAPGQRVIVFLSKDWTDSPLGEAEFTYAFGGIGAWGVARITNGKVNVNRDGTRQDEPVTEFANRMQRYAREAGIPVP